MASKESVEKWQEVVNTSKGVSQFLPDALTEDAENVETSPVKEGKQCDLD